MGMKPTSTQAFLQISKTIKTNDFKHSSHIYSCIHVKLLMNTAYKYILLLFYTNDLGHKEARRMANLCIPLFSVGKNLSGISWSAHCASTVTPSSYLHRRLSNNGHRLIQPTSKNTCALMIQKCPTIQLTHLPQDSSLTENMIERESNIHSILLGKRSGFQGSAELRHLRLETLQSRSSLGYFTKHPFMQ